MSRSLFLPKWLILGYFSLRWLCFTKIFKKFEKKFMSREFGWQLKLPVAVSGVKFGNFTKARINKNMFYKQGVNIYFATMRFIKA